MKEVTVKLNNEQFERLDNLAKFVRSDPGNLLLAGSFSWLDGISEWKEACYQILTALELYVDDGTASTGTAFDYDGENAQAGETKATPMVETAPPFPAPEAAPQAQTPAGPPPPPPPPPPSEMVVSHEPDAGDAEDSGQKKNNV